MSNTNNNVQTQTSNTLHNAIMEAGSKDRPPMLAPGNYVQWKSRMKRYIDTKPNHKLIHHCLKNPPYNFTWADTEILISKGSLDTRTKSQMETYKTVSQDIRDQLNAEAKTVQIILNGIDNDIYSTIDACPNACEMWKAIERSQQAATRNREKAIVNSPQPIYDQEPSMVAEDNEMSEYKDIDKLMALISLSFKKIYKPTNNNLRTSSNTSRANPDNSPKINRSAGYENQRIGNVVGARETVGSIVVQKSRIQCYNCNEFRHVVRECQKPKWVKDAAYHREKMLLYAADSGPIFDDEPLQKVSNDDHYNVFAMESKHPEQSKSIHETYPIEQDAHNVIIDSLNMSYDREEIDQNDDDNDLTNERELFASLIEKLKCEIDESKNHNKFLETSNKVLIEKLKGEIEDFKNKNKSLESSNNRFKEANNKLSETNNLLYTVFKKSQAELARRNSMEYASKVEIDCAKARGDLMSYKMKSQNLKAKTLNVNFVCATCGKYVLNEKHGMCVLKSVNGVNSRTKMPIAVHVSTREPKCTVKQSVTKPIRKTVDSESNHKPRNIARKLYGCVRKACSWWYPKLTPSGYKWKPNSEKKMLIRMCSKHMEGNLKLLINFMKKFLGTVKFGNDQITPILGYRDLVQGAVTIKRVYYVEGLNHNLFSVGQFYDADLEVAFRKSTCYICDLKGNDLLTGSRGTDLYSITLQDTNCPNPICLMAKAISSQAWLWHRHLSHLNFYTINLLSKNDIMVGLPKLKFIKDHLCSSCELRKAKRKSFHTKITPSSKRRLQLLHMDLCGPMRVASINGKRYVL
nr:integrase, catalytic region, zinc finger, CCHC-type, peptidase aspartic, catalytic [Tanacetum cinerariifolium]